MSITSHVPQVREVKAYHQLLDGGLAADQFDWVPFVQPGRAGVDVEWLYTTEETAEGAEACIARYAPGAHSNLHEHLGYELILVLDGELRNDSGDVYQKGTLVLEHPASVHKLTSPLGCTLLIVREKGMIVDLSELPDDAVPDGESS